MRANPNSKVIAWRCWYDDGSVYDSRDHEWADLPDDGILIKMIYYADGTKQIQQGTDYYYEAPHHAGIVQGAGMARDEIERRYPGAVVKRGRWAPDSFYAEVVARAMASTWDS